MTTNFNQNLFIRLFIYSFKSLKMKMNLNYFIIIYKLKVLLLVKTIDASLITFSPTNDSDECKYLIKINALQ